MADDTTPHAKAPVRHQPKRRASSYRAEEKFRARVKELGGTVVELAWKGNGAKHEIRCREGHTSYPYPNRVAQGVGICRTCAGCDPRAAEQRVLARLEEVGATMLDSYRGMLPRTRFRCAKGHEFVSIPAELVQAKNVCRVCAGRDAESLFAAFRQRVEDQGGVLVSTSWLGSHTPHDALCRDGHPCRPRPSGLLSGKNICRICACRDPRVVEARFRERVAELGGTVLGSWATIHVPILVRCPDGHEVTPVPNMVIRGQGLCRFCKGKAWDVFYVVQDELNDVIKFGITSGSPKQRLAVHERDGFDQVVRLHADLPDCVAPWLERAIISALRDAREEPVRGREYYRARVLPVVLDLVDNHPMIRSTR